MHPCSVRIVNNRDMPLLAAAFAMTSVLGQAPTSLTLPSIISDNMVLQRQGAAPIWGRTAPGRNISVSFQGQTRRARSGPDGKWSVRLSQLQATTGATMEITDGVSTKTIGNILVGEVWVASGQSNMEWPLRQTQGGEDDIRRASYNEIRLFQVTNNADANFTGDIQGKWTAVTPETAASFSAVAYHFGREIHETAQVPVGLIDTTWGGTPAQAWTPRDALLGSAVTAYYAQNIKPEDAKKPGTPTALFEGMVRPLIPFGIKGVIWYQGESNAAKADEYRTLFPVMIRSWRSAWGQGDFPFLWVQLANFMQRVATPGESNWAALREAQTQTLRLPNTAMAVTIDIGEANDIHPRNKRDVGRRLAMAARTFVYRGQEPSGLSPVYDRAEFSGPTVTLRFRNAGGLTTSDGKAPRGFAIKDRTGGFIWADARIDGDRIIVSSPQAPNPVAVRYGWADNPDVNVVNSVGLPMSPFRTDQP